MESLGDRVFGRSGIRCLRHLEIVSLGNREFNRQGDLEIGCLSDREFVS